MYTPGRLACQDAQVRSTASGDNLPRQLRQVLFEIADYGSSRRREWDGRRCGRGLGREVTRLVLAWAFDALGVHRVELEVLASNSRALNCYLACGFRREGVRREAELYPDGWKDFIMMGILRSEHASQAEIVPGTDAADFQPPG